MYQLKPTTPHVLPQISDTPWRRDDNTVAVDGGSRRTVRTERRTMTSRQLRRRCCFGPRCRTHSNAFTRKEEVFT
uniref:Uncharacterized protein n=1 Tax=Oryza punctata TaxID=4537 RepID=A0A0E0JYW3_ORYPU